jgi:alpha-N-acetylglucosaminidase
LNNEKAFLGAVPRGRMLVLDLYSEMSPVWSRSDGFYGTDYVWNMLHNFGGRSGLYVQ